MLELHIDSMVFQTTYGQKSVDCLYLLYSASHSLTTFKYHSQSNQDLKILKNYQV